MLKQEMGGDENPKMFQFQPVIRTNSSRLGGRVVHSTDALMVNSKRDSYWAQYQGLLVRRPVAMNITQGGIITAAGSILAQIVTEHTVKAQPVIEQVLLTVCFIAPVVSMWIPFLGGLRLHWTKATAVDQVLVSLTPTWGQALL